MKKRPVKNFKDITRDFAKKENIRITDSEQLVDSFLELIIGTVMNGYDIQLKGFGKFYYQRKKGKVVHHPRTGELVTTKDYDTMLFRISRTVRVRMNWEDDEESADEV